MTKQITAYFHGILAGANAHKCRKIFENYKGVKWATTKEYVPGTIGIAYDVPDESVEPLSALLLNTGFSLTPPAKTS